MHSSDRQRWRGATLGRRSGPRRRRRTLSAGYCLWLSRREASVPAGPGNVSAFRASGCRLLSVSSIYPIGGSGGFLKRVMLVAVCRQIV